MIDEKKLIKEIKENVRLHKMEDVDAYIAIMNIIEEQPIAGDWIPVEERLPNNDEEVLVWFEYFRYGSYDCLFQTVGIGLMINDHWSCIVNGTTGWKDLKILAWMPLPDEYREEDKE